MSENTIKTGDILCCVDKDSSHYMELCCVLRVSYQIDNGLYYGVVYADGLFTIHSFIYLITNFKKTQ